MKEDVLEQVVDDYLQSIGFLTTHNVRFKPSPSHPDYVANQDSVPSDIDVLGYAPNRFGADRVWVISCKAWQEGLDPGKRLDELRQEKVKGKSQVWRRHREVWSPKWGLALCDRVEELTGQRGFRYFTAVTRLRGKVSRWHEWREEEQIQTCLEGNWVGFLRLEDMWQRTIATSTTTLAGSVMGRLAQMLIAAGQAQPEAPDEADDDPQLTRPHEQDEDDYPSVAGMWIAPPPVADAGAISRYAHTVDGYSYAKLHYGRGGTPERLYEFVRDVDLDRTSFERLRLAQFYEARSWHHQGYEPGGMTPTGSMSEDREGVNAALALHHAIEAAWSEQRFDRLRSVSASL